VSDVEEPGEVNGRARALGTQAPRRGNDRKISVTKTKKEKQSMNGSGTEWASYIHALNAIEVAKAKKAATDAAAKKEGGAK